jgi:hypothetical protein
MSRSSRSRGVTMLLKHQAIKYNAETATSAIFPLRSVPTGRPEGSIHLYWGSLQLRGSHVVAGPHILGDSAKLFEHGVSGPQMRIDFLR